MRYVGLHYILIVILKLNNQVECYCTYSHFSQCVPEALDINLYWMRLDKAYIYRQVEESQKEKRQYAKSYVGIKRMSRLPWIRDMPLKLVELTVDLVVSNGYDRAKKEEKE